MIGPLRIAVHPGRHFRAAADRVVAILEGIDGVVPAGRGQDSDVHIYVGGLPAETSGEQWWLEAVHSGVPGGSAFGALEIADRVPLAGIQLCARRGTKCVTLAEAWLRTDPYSPSRMVGRLWDAGLSLLHTAALRRIDATETVLPRSVPRQIELTAADRARLRARSAHGFTSIQGDEIFRSDHWSIGVVDAPIHRFLEPNFRPEVIWSPSDGAEIFCGDPFGVPEGRGVRLYYERFDFAHGLGTLATRTYSFGGWGPQENVLTLESHLSYPYLIEHASRRYVVPESGDAGLTMSYVLDEHEQEAIEPKLMLDFPALDSTVLEHDGKWWLFATDARIKHVDVLHIWFSEISPLGPWTPHRLNPVKTDIRATRPGGTPFRFEGSLYRPTQVGTTGYGGSVEINRIDLLTTRDFRETGVRQVHPFKDRPDGVHTLSAVGDTTLVDGKLRRVVPSTVTGRLKGKTGRFFGLG
ncbi:MAG: hypothetical protein ACJAYU_003537 [Bradymonadia bacterium]|jgi:hypothetical protein